jgi:ATP-dependent RNA helicase SUPV3L1/SUV3
MSTRDPDDPTDLPPPPAAVAPPPPAVAASDRTADDDGDESGGDEGLDLDAEPEIALEVEPETDTHAWAKTLAEAGLYPARREKYFVAIARGKVPFRDVEIPYAVTLPAPLAKSTGWKRMSPEDRLARAEAAAKRVDHGAIRAALGEVLERFGARLVPKAMSAAEFEEFATRSLTDNRPQGLEERISTLRSRFERVDRRITEEAHREAVRSAIDLGAFPDYFHVARRMPRRFVALLGPTNSGKTWEALNALARAKTGCYLAPLRLLALEGREALEERGVPTSLLTGEERLITEGAAHVASTIEMADWNRPVEVAIIDEIQMLEDSDRGSAWVAAVCGIPAETVYLVGAAHAREAIEALAHRLGVPLEVRRFERKGPLEMEKRTIEHLRDIRRGDAVIVFSRRDVLYWRELLVQRGLSVATIYGNLAPEVRRGEAKRFREGVADVVVATDAIGMGLNLPIARVVFTTHVKWNGEEEELLRPVMVQQIAGRAGRFGIHEAGAVTTLDAQTHAYIAKALAAKPKPLPTAGFPVAASLEHLRTLSGITGETSLSRVLGRFTREVDSGDGFFVPTESDDVMEKALFLDTLKLPLNLKYTLAQTPLSLRVPPLASAWQGWMQQVAQGGRVAVDDTPIMRSSAVTLERGEDLGRLLSAYVWLAWRLPEKFPDLEEGLRLRSIWAARVESLLVEANTRRTKRGLERERQGQVFSTRGEDARRGERRTDRPRGGPAKAGQGRGGPARRGRR